MNYEPSEKEKYIRKATKEYADRIRAMFPHAEACIKITGLNMKDLSEIAEPMRNDEGEFIRIRLLDMYHYIHHSIKEDGYEIEQLSE